MVYDSVHKKVILYGGIGSGGLLGDTWVYDVGTNTWVQMFPEESPPPMRLHAMAYDAAHDTTVLVGGDDPNGHYIYQTWHFQLRGETDTKPPVPPTGLKIVE